MSDMIEKLEHAPVPDPGLPEHQYRPTDVDPALEKRAERQIAAMFGVAALLSVGFVIAYFSIEKDQTFLGWSAQNFALGTTLGVFTFIVMSRESVAARYAPSRGIPDGVGRPPVG